MFIYSRNRASVTRREKRKQKKREGKTIETIKKIRGRRKGKWEDEQMEHSGFLGNRNYSI